MNLENLETTKTLQAASKQAELQEEQGQEVTLTLVLPDGSAAQHRLPAGVTVAYVKLVVEKQHGLPVVQQVLKLDDKVLMDPFSLCDYPAMQAGKEATVRVQLQG